MELSKILFVRNSNAKRYIIRILPDRTIRVTIPRYGSEKEARRFLNENISQLKERINQKSTALFEIGKDYYSKYYKIRILSTKSSNTSQTINRTIDIKISDTLEIESEQAQAYIHFVLEQVLRKEARLYIPKRSVEFAEQFKLKISNIKINSAKTRWGSCSGINSLNFSLFLMQLPYELIDYIILHELAHTIHKNHSSEFYNTLNTFCGGKHEQLNKKLKHFSPIIEVENFQKL